jgi:hypothetical protein
MTRRMPSSWRLRVTVGAQDDGRLAGRPLRSVFMVVGAISMELDECLAGVCDMFELGGVFAGKETAFDSLDERAAQHHLGGRPTNEKTFAGGIQ